MVEGVLVIKKGREKSLIEIVLDIISKPKKRQQFYLDNQKNSLMSTKIKQKPT